MQSPNQYYPHYEYPFIIPIWMPSVSVVHLYGYFDQNIYCPEINPIDDAKIDFDAISSLIGTNWPIYNLKQGMINFSS
jgi:hypothetical protein